jgi:hypothetical protein
MMWNHVVVVHAAYDCLRRGFTVLGSSGMAAAALSLLYHSHEEKAYQLTEGVVAKMTMLLLVYQGLRHPRVSTADAVLPSLAVFTLWRLSQHVDYERWHPWMHILIAADVHYFLKKSGRAPRAPLR